MKKTTLKTRLWALAATLLLLVSLLAMPVSAANTAPTENLTKTFNKYLVMDANANVPNVEFEFTIDAGTAVEATASSPAIYAGIVQMDGDTVTAPTVEKAEFSYNTHHASTVDGLPTDNATTTENKKYATDEVTVDFTGISFTAPGIYRYTITESDSTASEITNDTVKTRTLDVYVQYRNIGTKQDPKYSDTELEVSHYVLHEGTGNPADATKSPGFTNTYTTYDLTLKKEVEGNQGDRDKYFMFTVNISNAVPGTVYSVVLPSEDNYAGNTQRSLTVDENGKVVDAIFYLKNDQSIVIQGLTEDTKYTIEEESYSDDGYSTSYTVQVDDQPASTPSEALTTVEKTMDTGDNIVTFTNTKNGSVPTGILLETAPYLILGAVVVVGLVVLFATRRRRTRE